MSVNFTWKVGTLEAYPEYKGKSNFIFNVHWTCYGTKEYSGSTYQSNAIGVQSLLNPRLSGQGSGSQFIPYENLNENTILSWVFNRFGTTESKHRSKEEIEQSVERQINEKITPSVIKLPLVWNVESEISGSQP